jgi:hypothetical protein
MGRLSFERGSQGLDKVSSLKFESCHDGRSRKPKISEGSKTWRQARAVLDVDSREHAKPLQVLGAFVFFHRVLGAEVLRVG